MKNKIKDIPIVSDILLLLQFFTRIPVKLNLNYSDESFKNSAHLLSLLGLIVSLPLLGLYYLLDSTGLNYDLISIIVVTFWILITGAFHYDGMADTCDGMFSGRNKDRILEIMKDSRIGSYGTIATVLDIIFKFIILKSIFYYGNETLLILILMGGKLSLCVCAYLGKPAKEKSSGNVFINNTTIIAVLVNIAFYILAALFLDKIRLAITSLVFIVVFNYIFIRYSNKKIDGIVGDNLGFSNEIGEIIVGCILTLI